MGGRGREEGEGGRRFERGWEGEDLREVSRRGRRREKGEQKRGGREAGGRREPFFLLSMVLLEAMEKKMNEKTKKKYKI